MRIASPLRLFPAFRLGAVATVAILLTACATQNEDPTATWNPDKIYTEAQGQMNSSGYDKAIELLEKLEGRAAGTPLAQQAQIDKAYAQYRNGDRAQAIATLDRFLMLHPTSPAADYALYLQGLINFNDDLGMFSWLTKRDLSERDQRAAKDSFESFKALVERFPNSKYAPDAHQRMLYIVNALAAYEVHVASYYYSRGAYVAAINRAQQALQDYKDSPALVEALHILERSYDALGMTDLRDDTRRVIRSTLPPTPNATTDAAPKRSWWKLWGE